MSKNTKVEYKVGIFVLMALGALTVFIFSVTDSSIFAKGKTIKVVFGFVNGVKISAPVRVAGVDGGIVKDIRLFFDQKALKTKVEIDLWVEEDLRIPVDSIIMINQLGILGEKYVEVIPGINTSEFFEEGKIYYGKDPIAMESLSERVFAITHELEGTISGVNQIINDEQNILAIRKALDSVSIASSGLSDIIGDLKSEKGTVGKLLYDEALYDDLQMFALDLKENPWKLFYRPKKKR